MTYSPRSGHLGIIWEAAVGSAFVLVILTVVTVVVCQVRRKRRRLRAVEGEGVPRGPGRQKKRANPSDLERGEVIVVDEDFNLETVEEREGEEEETENPHRTPRTTTPKPKSKPRPKHTTKGKSIRHESSPSNGPAQSPTSSDDYYFEHPSQKPPKYYWER